MRIILLLFLFVSCASKPEKPPFNPEAYLAKKTGEPQISDKERELVSATGLTIDETIELKLLHKELEMNMRAKGMISADELVPYLKEDCFPGKAMFQDYREGESKKTIYGSKTIDYFNKDLKPFVLAYYCNPA